MTKKRRKSHTPAKFKVGDKVRVKDDIWDTDYPDMPLGGWAGTIAEVHKDRMIDEFYGILCEAREGRRLAVLPLGELDEVKKEKSNRCWVEDYSYWFWNWR